MFDEVTILEPPKPIHKTEYKCDKIFHVNSLLRLYDQPELCGLVWINGQCTSFYSIDMTSLNSNKISNRSTRLKKHNKGGQSAARFGRLHQESVVRYLKGIAEDTQEYFDEDNIKTIIIGGHGKKKDKILSYLHGDISNKVIGTITLTEKDTIPNIFDKMKQTYQKHQIYMEEKELSYYIYQIENNTNKAVYGLETVKQYLKNGYLERLYIDFDHYRDRIYQIEKICGKYGCQMIMIGKSQMAQTLIKNYGSMFAVMWFAI